MVASYVGENKEFARQYLAGELEVELTPQGTLAERLRAGGSGIPAFFTADRGRHPGRRRRAALAVRRRRQRRGRLAAQGGARLRVDGRDEASSSSSTAIVADFGLVRAWKGDRHGNLVFNKRARNFNPLAAMAGRVTIAEVEELVEPGELDPDQVHLPGIYVQRVLPLDARAGRRQAHRAPHRPPAADRRAGGLSHAPDP